MATPVRWCLVLALLQAAAAQDATGTAKPADLDLGELRVGAVVEASFHVHWSDPAFSTATAEVTLPPMARLLGARNWRRSTGQAVTTVQFAVDTVRAGEIAAAIDVRCNGATATAALRATVTDAVPGGSRVLAMESPFEADSTDEAITFAAWRELVHHARLDVDYRLARDHAPLDTEALGRVDIVLLGESAICKLDDETALLLRGFVCGGGRVLLFANAFYVGTVAGANKVGKPFGLTMHDTEPRTLTGFEVDAQDLPRHPLLAGVESIKVSRPSPVQVARKGTALITLPDMPLPFASLVTTQSGGEVVGVGTSLWWNWIRDTPGNQRFLRNLLTRAPRLR